MFIHILISDVKFCFWLHKSSTNIQILYQIWKYLKINFRSSNGYSNESLESLNLSSEDAESDREMDIEEEDELDDDSIDEVVIQKEVEILRGEENEPWPSIRVPFWREENGN